MGNVGHRLGTARNDNVGITGDDSLGAEDDGLSARSADLIHCGRDSMLSKSSTESALTCGVLTKTG